MPTETLGEYLKRERELRNISLEEMAEGTKIAMHMLRAMEEDRWNDIPADVFAKGFIRSYAEFIGLVPDDVLLRYQEEYRARQTEDKGREAMRVRGNAREFSNVDHLRWAIPLVFALVIAIGFGIWLFLGRSRTVSPPLPETAAPTQSVAPATAPRHGVDNVTSSETDNTTPAATMAEPEENPDKSNGTQESGAEKGASSGGH